MFLWGGLASLRRLITHTCVSLAVSCGTCTFRSAYSTHDTISFSGIDRGADTKFNPLPTTAICKVLSIFEYRLTTRICGTELKFYFPPSLFSSESNLRFCRSLLPYLNSLRNKNIYNLCFKNNGYPTCFIECSATYASASTTSDKPTTNEQKSLAIVTIPYVQGLSEPIRRLLERLRVKVRLRPNKTLCQILVGPKDKVPMENQTGVVYSILCHDCPKTYVAQSGRLLECRIKEHERAVRNGGTNTPAIVVHVWQEQQSINWPVAMILDSSQYLNSRLILESWHIHQQPDPMNRERGSLPSVYCSLIRNKNKKQ